MLNWLKNKKITKAYETDIVALKDMLSKKTVLRQKHSEIYDNPELRDDEKETLLGLINSQIDLINQDAILFGASMQHYFESDVIHRAVPLGVDFSEREYLQVKNPTDLMMSLTPKLHRDGSRASTTTKAICTKMDIRDDKNGITDKKIKTIKKLNLKPELKKKLQSMHEASYVKRKENLIIYLSKVNPGTIDLVRENKIIDTLVMHTIDKRGQTAMITNISETIMSVENSIFTDGTFKTIIDINFLLGVPFSTRLPTEMVTKLKENWVEDLRATNMHVFTKGTAYHKGESNPVKTTTSTGPQ